MSTPASSQAVKPFIITVSARALFDLEESHQVFESQGTDAFSRYQIERENEPLKHGPAYGLVRKILAINKLLPAGAQPFEVILLSRNSPETGLRIFNAIERENLPISRAIFTSGESTANYIDALEAKLFLSSNPVEVKKAIDAGIAAATVLPTKSKVGHESQIRIAFDGDAVLFSDEAERVHMTGGLTEFHRHEISRAADPLPPGPFHKVLEAIHRIQAAFPDAASCPVRTALVTARSAPAHKRTILTLRHWGVRLDEAMFLGGRNKAPFLKAFAADLFFDDSPANIELAKDFVASAHVPSGIRNSGEVDESHFTGGAQASRAVEESKVRESAPAEEVVVPPRRKMGPR